MADGLWKDAKHPMLVTTEHNTYNRRRSMPVLKHFDRWMYSRYESIICISDQAETNMREFLPTTKGIRTIYNGVNVSKFHDAQPIEGLHPEGKTVVVMVAAFRPQKDQKTLIDAFKHLSEENFELWIVGDGELHDEIHGYARGAYDNDTPQPALSQSKGYDNDNDDDRSALPLGSSKNDNNDDDLNKGIVTYGNIKFFGNRPDVPEILHTADIVVMSSHYEGLSLSSVEGMSVGKPFIASDVDGLHEVVNGYGVLVPHQDAQALADEITHLASDTTYYHQVADRCWQRAQMFDIQKMVDGYLGVYGRLCLR